ncbi:PEP-CTERM sorting domain-containing protein [Gloeocapsa sp. PCC 73106]|uniref:PEP-CTERM sorting domain-containing protein n=1 Tax=Gloeocapsa sp. PCC 73106 TaxID=102232 RepID=UPI0002AC5D5A|nr:PEP-CTERM sorting domain-containing protein [Gloeocapsa sp. PCC 73106]ELR97010.1 PEP-CTERM putative exosortase interaction domain-containing protein [Gloeocapsa sp. PCC 73106]
MNVKQLKESLGLLSLSLLFSLTSPAAQAMGIIFTHQGSGTGTLDGVPFGPADFVITGIGDTDNRENISSSVFSIDHDSASIDLNGLGSFDFITTTRTFLNGDSNTPGFSRSGIDGTDLFNGPSDSAFNGYDLLSSIGPITGSGDLLQWTLSDVVTDGGILVFDSNDTVITTFQATLVPEPITILGSLLVFSITGLVKRKSRSN